MYTANQSTNWTITPNLLNQTTLSWYHGSMGIVTLPVSARNRAPDFRVPRYFDTITDSGGFIPSISMSQGYAGIDLRWPQNISHYTWELLDKITILEIKRERITEENKLRHIRSELATLVANDGQVAVAPFAVVGAVGI